MGKGGAGSPFPGRRRLAIGTAITAPTYRNVIGIYQPHGLAETEGAMNRLDQKAMLRPSMMRRAHP